jgi:RNA polymerase sigma-70 factor (ECF subfamily)
MAYNAEEVATQRVSTSPQDDVYLDAAALHSRDIARFVAGYECDLAKRQDLLQEVHVALWQSFASFRGQCSLRTWVYRVAHNTCASHIERSVRRRERDYVTLEEIESLSGEFGAIESAERHIDLQRVYALIYRLQPPDREVMLLYLEDLDAASIGEITGLSARNVATKVHRIKAMLARQLTATESSQ